MMRHSAHRNGPAAETTRIWVTLLRALIAFALVSVLLAGTTKPALANFIAIYCLLGSVLTLRWALANRGRLDTTVVSAAALAGHRGRRCGAAACPAHGRRLGGFRRGSAGRCRHPHRRPSVVRRVPRRPSRRREFPSALPGGAGDPGDRPGWSIDPDARPDQADGDRRRPLGHRGRRILLREALALGHM